MHVGAACHGHSCNFIRLAFTRQTRRVSSYPWRAGTRCPDTPLRLVNAKVQGSIELEITVGLDGRVRDAMVVKSLDTLYGMDDSAVSTVSQWVFEPAKLDGKAVSARSTVTFTMTSAKPQLRVVASAVRRKGREGRAERASRMSSISSSCRGRLSRSSQGRRNRNIPSNQRLDDLVELRGMRGRDQHPRLVEAMPRRSVVIHVRRGRAVRIPDVVRAPRHPAGWWRGSGRR